MSCRSLTNFRGRGERGAFIQKIRSHELQIHLRVPFVRSGVFMTASSVRATRTTPVAVGVIAMRRAVYFGDICSS